MVTFSVGLSMGNNLSGHDNIIGKIRVKDVARRVCHERL